MNPGFSDADQRIYERGTELKRAQKERIRQLGKNLIKNRKLETIYPDGEKILSRARAYRIFYPSTAIAQKEVS